MFSSRPDDGVEMIDTNANNSNSKQHRQQNNSSS